MPQSTPGGKWVIYDVSSGKRLERWPVDAREQVASGDYTYDSPTGEIEQGNTVVPAPVVVPPPEIPKHPTGAPTIIASTESTAAAPVQLPTGRTRGAARPLPGASPSKD